MPSNRFPGTLSAPNNNVTASPAQNTCESMPSKLAAFRATKLGASTTCAPFFKPRKAMNSPMPTEIAFRMLDVDQMILLDGVIDEGL